MEVSILHVQIASGDGLGTQAIEEGNIGAAGYAQVGILQRLFLLGRLRYHLDSLRVEHPNVVPIAVGLLGHLENTQITHTVVQENSISTNWYPDYRQIISKPQAMQLC